MNRRWQDTERDEMPRGWGAQGEVKPRKQKEGWGAQDKKPKRSRGTEDEDSNHRVEEFTGVERVGLFGQKKRR